jgi:signal peptidase
MFTMQNSKAKKIVSIVLNVLVWIFLIFAILVTIVTFATQNAQDGVPSVFGKSIVSIQSDSMKSDKAESFKDNDLVIIEKITESKALELNVGDIITYRAPIDINGDGHTGDINTHRIVEKRTDDGGIVWYRTQGDNKEMCPNPDGYELRHTDVIGVYNGSKIVALGGILDFLSSSIGFLLIIVLPMALFFLYEVYNLIRVIMSQRATVKAGITAEQEEEIKRKAVEEFLAKQKAEAEQNSNTTEE